MPLLERDLFEGRDGLRLDRFRAPQKPAEQLDVERPARPERRGSRCHEGGSDAEPLRSALRVVDANPKDERGPGGKDSPEVMPARAPLDLAAEECDAGRGHDGELVPCFEDVE
jgi:hypothetical protein